MFTFVNSPYWDFANDKMTFSQKQTFTNLPKNRKIAILSFTNFLFLKYKVSLSLYPSIKNNYNNIQCVHFHAFFLQFCDILVMFFQHTLHILFSSIKRVRWHNTGMIEKTIICTCCLTAAMYDRIFRYSITKNHLLSSKVVCKSFLHKLRFFSTSILNWRQMF